MAANLILFFAIAAAATLISLTRAFPGTASFYTTYRPSKCYGNEDHGTLIAAANPGLYGNGAACGQRYTVRCTAPANVCRSGAVSVTVVDVCGGCAANELDLSREAFSTVANPNAAGRIQIDYIRV